MFGFDVSTYINTCVGYVDVLQGVAGGHMDRIALKPVLRTVRTLVCVTILTDTVTVGKATRGTPARTVSHTSFYKFLI